MSEEQLNGSLDAEKADETLRKEGSDEELSDEELENVADGAAFTGYSKRTLED
ncbi:MAG: hypothetical protein NTV57_02585 [Cyanobacteria bacterium]|nr:hypothetical protein [Cyanobacteriota bacterium]